ncbi:MAG: ribbon-helix-helix domain-containing protein [Candidatus Bathyarchaeia archaeon]
MIKRETATWNIQVPKALDKAVDEAITKNWHYTKTEFIREAVREKLIALGISPIESSKSIHTPEKHKKEDKNHD